MKNGRGLLRSLTVEGLNSNLDTESEADFDQEYSTLISPTTTSKPTFISKHLSGRFRKSLFLFLQVLAVLLITFILIFGSFSLFIIFKFLITRNQAFNSFFPEPLIPKVHSLEQLLSQPVISAHNSSLEVFQSELDRKLLSLGLPVSTLECPFTSTTKHHYSTLKSNSTSKILIALNLYNNEVVFPTLARTLLSITSYLGPESIHISIFENGSIDKLPLALAHFASILTGMKIEHTIVSERRITDWSRVDRIAQLSIYRNLVLEPLSFNSKTKWDTVLFLNDVFVCETDILELLYQKKLQNASAVCGFDWRSTKKFGLFKGIKFYDNWVSRTITGDMFRSRFDIVGEFRNGLNELFNDASSKPSFDRFQSGLPFAVYSCWNGMIALSAEPFIVPDEKGEVVRFRSAFNREDECAASECKTIAKDFWARNYSRWMIVPSVRVTYEQSVYNHFLLEDLVTRKFSLPLSSGISELIDWTRLKAPTSVVCYSWVRGFHLDLPFRKTRKDP